MISCFAPGGSSVAPRVLLAALLGLAFFLLRGGGAASACFLSLFALHLHEVLAGHRILATWRGRQNELNAELERVCKASACLIWELDREGIVAAPRGAIPGFSGASMDGKLFLAFVHRDDRERVKTFLHQQILARETFDHLELRLRTPDDEARWVDLRGIPRFDDAGALLSFQITARHRDEIVEVRQALGQRESELRSLLDVLPGSFYRALPGPQGTFTFVSPEIESLTGYPMADFLHEDQRSFRSLIHPADLAGVQSALATAIQTHRYFELRYRICRADGDLRHIFERGRATYHPSGELNYLEGALIDVSRELETGWATPQAVPA